MTDKENEIANGIYRGFISFSLLLIGSIAVLILQALMADYLNIRSIFLAPFGCFAIYAMGRVFRP